MVTQYLFLFFNLMNYLFCAAYFVQTKFFFKICVLSQCIVYWIYFQNIHTFTYQKTLLHYTFFPVFKIVESFQRILKKHCYSFFQVSKSFMRTTYFNLLIIHLFEHHLNHFFYLQTHLRRYYLTQPKEVKVKLLILLLFLLIVTT